MTNKINLTRISLISAGLLAATIMLRLVHAECCTREGCDH